MAPKKKAKLDRSKLEEVASERIDAVTADDLHPTKFIEIVSPDGKLRLFYNTSTLIRIGLEKGMMMQPPHFREEMKAELKQLVEKLEGKKLAFGDVQRRQEIEVDGVLLSEVVHRHVYFQQIVDEFFLLSPAEVYVCPICYKRWIDANPHWRRPVDPLDALSELDDTRLAQVVFRYARCFKKHLATHHWIEDDANDHRLRDVLCTYFSDYNEFHKSANLSLHAYWAMSARYNVVRYNEVVGITEAAHARDPEVWAACAFPDPEPPAPSCSRGRKKQASVTEESFLVEDDDEGESWAPMYEGSESSASDAPEPPRRSRKRRHSETSSCLSSSSSSSSSVSASEDASQASSEINDTADVAAPPVFGGSRSGYIKDHPVTDKRTYHERAYVQRELEKIHRQENRNFGRSGVRRPEMRSTLLDEVPEDGGDWEDFVNAGASSTAQAQPCVAAPRSIERVSMLVDDEDGE